MIQTICDKLHIIRNAKQYKAECIHLEEKRELLSVGKYELQVRLKESAVNCNDH